jgi:hypothetical protein
MIVRAWERGGGGRDGQRMCKDAFGGQQYHIMFHSTVG